MARATILMRAFCNSRSDFHMEKTGRGALEIGCYSLVKKIEIYLLRISIFRKITGWRFATLQQIEYVHRYFSKFQSMDTELQDWKTTNSLSNKPSVQLPGSEAAIRMNNISNESFKYSSEQLFLTTPMDDFLEKALPKKCCKKDCFLGKQWKSPQNVEPVRVFVLTNSHNKHAKIL